MAVQEDVTWEGELRSLFAPDRWMFANRWVYPPSMAVYIRVNRISPFIEISNIQVDEELQGTGVFTAWLPKLEEIAKEHGRGVRFISVLTQRFHNYLLKLGYRDCPESVGYMCVEKYGHGILPGNTYNPKKEETTT